MTTYSEAVELVRSAHGTEIAEAGLVFAAAGAHTDEDYLIYLDRAEDAIADLASGVAYVVSKETGKITELDPVHDAEQLDAFVDI